MDSSIGHSYYSAHLNSATSQSPSAASELLLSPATATLHKILVVFKWKAIILPVFRVTRSNLTNFSLHTPSYKCPMWKVNTAVSSSILQVISTRWPICTQLISISVLWSASSSVPSKASYICHYLLFQLLTAHFSAAWSDVYSQGSY